MSQIEKMYYIKEELHTEIIEYRCQFYPIIKSIIFNFRMVNDCNPLSKVVYDIVKSEYIINKIFDNPNYIFIIIYKLNIRRYFDMYILYLIYLIAFSIKNKNINISLLNMLVIALSYNPNAFRNAYFKIINNRIKLIGECRHYYAYNDLFEKFINRNIINNKILKNVIIYDRCNVLLE
ncbi:hypothetical protein H8356DRAFT_1090209 [Neocallimastix lanati (nom. inval.)]|nr:hypothetical protein H8356DRAFT_1091443 [Neocallimastix sp. JGI-2020a]KAG4081528.1 hypothetical protein H8356DRAFT_1091206 [Neocallimastix sp. JGI-2020a]KAG4082519.1 hypothetical protein H8356DRAFT_1090209 [Neocallimastix sp. JGI-2020a]